MRASKRTPDGVEIIAREPAMGESPNLTMKGKLVPFTGVTKLLLADDTECHECDTCGKIFPTVKQVVSHSTYHVVTTKRNTDVATIKLVLRTVAQERATAKSVGRRPSMKNVADDLNHRGIKTYRGHAWTDGSVYNIWRSYHNIYRVRASQVRTSTRPLPTTTTKVAADTAVAVAPPKAKGKSVLTALAKKANGPAAANRRLFDFILRDIKELRTAADNLETHVTALKDSVRSTAELQLDDQAVNALELLRRAWQQS